MIAILYILTEQKTIATDLSAEIAQYKVEPSMYPGLFNADENYTSNSAVVQKKRRKKYFPLRQKESPISSKNNQIKFLTNGQPNSVQINQLEEKLDQDDSTIRPVSFEESSQLNITSEASGSSPLTWLSNNFLFNGLPGQALNILPTWMETTWNGIRSKSSFIIKMFLFFFMENGPA